MDKGYESNQEIDPEIIWTCGPTLNSCGFPGENRKWSNCDKRRLMGGFMSMSEGTIEKTITGIPNHFKIKARSSFYFIGNH